MQIELNQEVLTEIHNHTIDILSRRGFRFSWPEAVEIFKKHGFRTSDDIVYFTADQVEEALARELDVAYRRFFPDNLMSDEA